MTGLAVSQGTVLDRFSIAWRSVSISMALGKHYIKRFLRHFEIGAAFADFLGQASLFSSIGNPWHRLSVSFSVSRLGILWHHKSVNASRTKFLQKVLKCDSGFHVDDFAVFSMNPPINLVRSRLHSIGSA